MTNFCVLLSLLLSSFLAATVAVESNQSHDSLYLRHAREEGEGGRALGLWFDEQDEEEDPTEDISKWRFGFRIPNQGIVGGTEAPSGAYPWFVSLEYNGRIYCGGALISANRVMSAAHCFFSSTGRIFLPTQVRIGHTTLTSGETIGVSCVSIHPSYSIDTQGLYNDIAIITLSGSSSATSFTTLNSNAGYPSSAGENLIPIGFGLTATGGSTSSTLKQTSVSFETESTCQSQWACMSTKYHVCGIQSATGVCQGAFFVH